MSPARRSPPRAGAIPLLLWLLLASSCAPATPYPPPRGQAAAIAPADSRELEQLTAAIAEHQRALDAARVDATPDCRRVCPLAANVCTLAERICALAGRYPGQVAVAASCDDARARCQRARQAAAERCACPRAP